MKELFFDKKLIIVFSIMMIFTSCTIYTEKRSEALSQAVFATADSIKVARFEKADEYAEQAKRLAYPPKRSIKIDPIITTEIKKVESINTTLRPTITSSKKSKNQTGSKDPIASSVITTTSQNEEKQTVLRLVIPEFLKHAKLLIQNSEEWNELIKQKEVKEQLERDNKNLKQLASDIDQELTKQQQYNNQIIADLNKLQKKVVEKDLHILRLYIVIAILIGAIGGGIYLRMKGVL